jgi:hypothetical protein
MILLLTAGGTSFDAMHKNAPICLRSRRQKWSRLPLKVSTVEKPNRISGKLCTEWNRRKRERKNGNYAQNGTEERGK